MVAEKVAELLVILHGPMMPVVVAVSFLGAAFLGIAAMGAACMRAAKVIAGSALALLIFIALVV